MGNGQAGVGRVIAVAALAVGLLSGPGAGAAAGQYVHGMVTYLHTEAPVVGATVLIFDTAGVVVGGASTGPDGRFSIPVTRQGPVTVYVEHPSAWAMVDGPVWASYVENTMVLFRLPPHPILLEGMSVEVKARSLALDRTGFYARREHRPGGFLDPKYIERRAPMFTTDLLRSVPGVDLLESRVAGLGTMPIMSGALRSQLDPARKLCFPKVVLDGVVINPGGNFWGPTNLDDLVHPQDLHAVEVYRSPAEAPVEFGGGLAACGLIVLWTKLGGVGGG